MHRERSSPYYVYSSGVGLTKVDPAVYRRNSESKLTQQRKFAVGDAPTPKRNSLRNPNHLYLKHLLEPLHDQYKALEVKLAVLEKLWAEEAVPLEYYSYFLNTLKRKVSRRQQFQLVLQEVHKIRERREYFYFAIAETVRARESVLGLICPYFEKLEGDGLVGQIGVLARSMQAEVLVHYSKETEDYQPVSPSQSSAAVENSRLSLVVKHILLYRQLTTKVVRLIWDWGCSLRREGYIGPVQFLHQGRDYFKKISQQDSLRISRCSELFDRHPYLMVKKQHEKNDYSLMFRRLKPNSTEAAQILDCIDILAAHHSAVLKMELVEGYNRDAQTQRTEHPRTKSLVERLYGSRVKLSPPANYLQRKHPVYLEEQTNPEKPEQFRIEQVRHQRSLVVRNTHHENENAMGRAQQQAKLEMLHDLNSKPERKSPSISEVVMRDRDYQKLIKLNFVEESTPPSPPAKKDDPDEHHQDHIAVEAVGQSQLQPSLSFLYVQMEEDRVLDFLENLFLERERSQKQIDHLLRKVLSSRDCAILKVTDQGRPGRDKLVALVVGREETLANGKLEFRIIELVLFNKYARSTLLQQLAEYLRQYNKYSSLAAGVPKSSDLDIIAIPTAKEPPPEHLQVSVGFKVNKKHKAQTRQICEQHPHLRMLYKSRNEDFYGNHLTYNQESQSYEFRYFLRFGSVSAVKVIVDARGTVRPYVKIRMDKVAKLSIGAHPNIQAYKLVQFGCKEVLQIVFVEDERDSLEDFDEELLSECQEQPPQTQVDVLMPVLKVRMKYLGSESEKVLFKQTIKLSDKNVTPQSLIRSKAKYLQRTGEYLFVPERFLLRIVDRQAQTLFSRQF